MKKIIHFLSVLTVFAIDSSPQPIAGEPANILPEKLHHTKLVDRFYQMSGHTFFWLGKQENTAVRTAFVSMLDSAHFIGLDKNDYHYQWLKSNLNAVSLDSVQILAADKVFTDAAIGFCKDIYQGHGVASWLSYDELSATCNDRDDDFILVGLSAARSVNELQWFVHLLEPAGKDYYTLKRELRSMIDSAKDQKIKLLSRSINLLRWLKHFVLDKYVVVNTAAATVQYYDCDTVKIHMKAVVGTVATPTPSFAGYCNAVVLYPYWHVPYSIAVKEILPLVKKDPSYLDRRGMQVISQGGKVIDPYSVKWSVLSAKQFPYQFRQSTGCDNALGVMKFNLTDPFSVYMHDTNNKMAFLAGARYFSHGCIRLEKPVELAMELLPGKIDTQFLEACYKDQKPVTLPLEKPVPVFVVYMPVVYETGDAVRYYKDVYRLVK